MNAKNPILDIYINILRDVHALQKFRENQVVQRGVWDAQVPRDVKRRLIDAEYVTIMPNVVYLTIIGLEIIEYKESTPSSDIS